MKIRLNRISQQPILSGNPDNNWERASCYNAAAIQEDDTIHLYYRATDLPANGREYDAYKSYIGHAVSQDGLSFQRDLNYVLGPIAGSEEARGCEDPRITFMGGKYYMTYTGYGGRYPGDYHICLATSLDLVNWTRQGRVLNESNKDAAFFPSTFDGNYLLLHRRSPNIWTCLTKDMKSYFDHQILLEIDPASDWEDYKVGIAGPPIETSKGYVLIYHGVSLKEKDFPGRGMYKQYALGIALLDKENPRKVIYRQKQPILEPMLAWEVSEGHVPNVVFSCGHVMVGGELYVYYGGADTSLGVASCSMSEIMSLFEKVEGYEGV